MGAKSFNQPLNSWDVSSVVEREKSIEGGMACMFDGSKLEKMNNLPDWY